MLDTILRKFFFRKNNKYYLKRYKKSSSNLEGCEVFLRSFAFWTNVTNFNNESLCHKLKFYNPFIFASCKSLIFQN